METITNFVSGIFTNIDSFITSTLENRYFFITIVVLTLLYGSLNTSRLTSNLLSCFDNPLSRLTMIGFIYYISTKNIPLAILMLTATVATMNAQNKHRLNFMMISLFRGSVFPMRKLLRLRRMSRRSSKRRTSRRRTSKRRTSRRRLSKRKLSKRRKYLKKLKYRKLQKLLEKIARYLNRQHNKKLPRKLIKLAVKAKQVAKEMGMKTPKIVKDITKSLIPVEVINRYQKDAQKLNSVKHVLTHRHLKIHPYKILLSNQPKKNKVDQAWVSLNDALKLGLPKPVSSFLMSQDLVRDDA